MRKIGWICLTIAALMTAACGGSGEDAVEAADGTGETDVAVTDGIEVPDEEVPVVEEVVLYPEGTLDPALVTPETPVSARALHEAYFAWNDRLITITAYPYIPYGGESLLVETKLELISEPGSSERLGTANFVEPPGMTVRSGELVALTGLAEVTWPGDLVMNEVIFVTPPAELVPLETSPWAYDGAAPIPVDQMYAMFHAWKDREVIVEGHYHSTTTSTTSYGTTIRVDLSDPDDTYTKYVACEMAAEIPADSDSLLAADRDGVLIRGTITGQMFDSVELEGCELLNR